jgi:hypothetical protein
MLGPVHNPNFFLIQKILATRHLTLKSQILFRISVENGSAVTSQSTTPTSPLSNSTPNCLLRASFSNFLSSLLNLTLGFQLPFQVLYEDVPYGKIINTLFTTQPLEMVPGFTVLIPGIRILPQVKFPATFDYYFLKILDENLILILKEYFQRAEIC